MTEPAADLSSADLFAAIDAGDDDAVAAALDASPPLASARDADGVSSTMHALYRGRPEIAEGIARTLPSLDIFEAAALGKLDLVHELLATDPSLSLARSADGFTALHYPAFFGQGSAAAVSEVLMAAGADVNARSDNDFAVLPIHSAVAGGHDDVVAVLVAAGADVNARQRHGWTPLHGAAQNGSLASVERLLAAGADPDARNDDGVTAVDLAATAGHDAVVARLTAGT
ncbi:MAG: ankyrin repeat domain-containing protein [Chloroflexi bacterium]|nr:ankyrin repeat domain-containing protein [Chloroflexota bacterium]